MNLTAVHRSLLHIGLLVSAWLPAIAQEQWSQQQYMSESGLLQNRVHVMVRDRWGALLIGTEGGLVRFDGDHFKQIGLSAQEGVRPSRVLDILPTDAGEYVVRDAGCRQYLYAGEEFSSITADAPTRQYASRFSGNVPSVKIAVAAMDPDSVLDGKSSWTGVVRPVVLANGRWCTRTDNELLVYADTVLIARYPLPTGRAPHLFALGEFLYTIDASAQVYRVDPTNGDLTKVVMEGFPQIESRNGVLAWRLFWDPMDRTASMVVRDDLYVLHSTAGGAHMRAERIPLRLPTDAKVGAVVWMQSQQVLAIGTDTKGLFIYRKNSMRSFLCEVALDGVNNAYNAQAPFGNSGVLTSSRGGARVFTAAGCMPGTPPIRRFDEGAIILDSQQRYWYGRGDTLFQYDLVSQEEVRFRAGMRPLSFFEEGDTLWVGTSKGIFGIVGGVATLRFPLSEGDLSSRPNALCRTPDGEFWMATCSGVYRTTAFNGWEVVPGFKGVCARTLAVHDAVVLVGTYGSGAYLYKNGSALRFPSDEQGFLTHVHAFMPDRSGFLWMSSNQGLFRTRWSDLQAWIADTTQRVYYAYYGKQAGIQNSEFNGGCSPSYVRTNDGWASFPTMDGLVWFQPEMVPDAYPVGKILVEGIFVDERPLAKDLLVPWDHREVLIRFSLAYWGDPENVRLEYRMDAITGERWVPLPLGQRELRIGQLPPGDRELTLRKIGSAVRGEEPLTFRFRVPTPYYRTAWFIGACVLSVALFLLFVIRLNAARLRRKNLVLERKVRERTRELVETNAVLRRSLEMKEMLVSIISHDIVTPLRFIARVANGVTRTHAGSTDERLNSTLLDLARSSDKLHANAQDLLDWIKRQDGRIDLRPRNVVVHLLAEEVFDMERERAADNSVILFNAIGLDDIIRTDRNVLSIVLHNVVANAVTHSPGAQVTISAVRVDGAYHITIRDTGSGMPPPALRHAQRVQAKGALGAMNEEGERDVQGIGLLIIADLLQLLGGSFKVESQQGVGTQVVLALPADIVERVPA
jgi:signal transduction histidine kinase/ligand-binding sensor domain-containing protein